MSKVLILQGPPCSGKTTYVSEYIKGKEQNTIVISKDAIRESLCGGNKDIIVTINTIERDRIVINTELTILQGGLIENFDIVIDDTNLNPQILSIFIDTINKYKAEYEIKPFYIPYKEAIKRNQIRRENGGHFVPEEIIQNYYQIYYSDLYEMENTK